MLFLEAPNTFMNTGLLLSQRHCCNLINFGGYSGGNFYCKNILYMYM